MRFQAALYVRKIGVPRKEATSSCFSMPVLCLVLKNFRLNKII